MTSEYVLLEGINHAVADAERLAELLKRGAAAPAKVNAIPYNPVPEFADLLRPSAVRVHAFGQALRRRAVPVTVRKEKGHEVSAACGQLRRHATPRSTDKRLSHALQRRAREGCRRPPGPRCRPRR